MKRLNLLKLWVSLSTLSASRVPLSFCHSTPQRFFPFFLSIVSSHWSITLNEPGSAPSQLPPPFLWVSSESAFLLRSHYLAGRLPAESRWQLSAPFSLVCSVLSSSLRHHPLPLCRSQFFFTSSRLWMFTVLTCCSCQPRFGSRTIPLLNLCGVLMLDNDATLLRLFSSKTFFNMF